MTELDMAFLGGLVVVALATLALLFYAHLVLRESRTGESDNTTSPNAADAAIPPWVQDLAHQISELQRNVSIVHTEVVALRSRLDQSPTTRMIPQSTRSATRLLQKETQKRMVSQYRALKRQLTKQEQELLQRWTGEWGFSNEVIMRAADEVSGTQNPMLDMNRLLENWRARNVKTVSDVEVLEAERTWNDNAGMPSSLDTHRLVPSGTWVKREVSTGRYVRADQVSSGSPRSQATPPTANPGKLEPQTRPNRTTRGSSYRVHSAKDGRNVSSTKPVVSTYRKSDGSSLSQISTDKNVSSRARESLKRLAENRSRAKGPDRTLTDNDSQEKTD